MNGLFSVVAGAALLCACSVKTASTANESSMAALNGEAGCEVPRGQLPIGMNPGDTVACLPRVDCGGFGDYRGVAELTVLTNGVPSGVFARSWGESGFEEIEYRVEGGDNYPRFLFVQSQTLNAGRPFEILVLQGIRSNDVDIRSRCVYADAGDGHARQKPTTRFSAMHYSENIRRSSFRCDPSQHEGLRLHIDEVVDSVSLEKGSIPERVEILGGVFLDTKGGAYCTPEYTKPMRADGGGGYLDIEMTDPLTSSSVIDCIHDSSLREELSFESSPKQDRSYGDFAYLQVWLGFPSGSRPAEALWDGPNRSSLICIPKNPSALYDYRAQSRSISRIH